MEWLCVYFCECGIKAIDGAATSTFTVTTVVTTTGNYFIFNFKTKKVTGNEWEPEMGKGGEMTRGPQVCDICIYGIWYLIPASNSALMYSYI